MADNDLNNAQAVTESDLKEAQPVIEPDLNNADSVDSKDDKLADGTSTEKTVPYAKLKEATEARKEAEERMLHAQRQLEINQVNAQQPQVQTQQAGSTYEQAMLDLSLTPDDLYDGNNQIKVQNRKTQLDAALQQQQTSVAANQQFMVSHPDFSQVVGSVNPTTGTILSWSAEVLALQSKKPYLTGAFNTAQGAYETVMAERNLIDLESKAAVNQEHLSRQAADLATQPLGGSAGGGGGAGDSQNQQMMSRDQVAEIERKLASGEEVN